MALTAAEFDAITGVTPVTATAAVFQVTAIPKEFIAASSYFYIHSPTTDYYVWFDTSGTDADPAPGGTGIKVDISGVAAKAGPGPVATDIQTAVDANAAFSATVTREVVTITNAVTGTTQLPADVNSGCFVGMSIYNEGGLYGRAADQRFVIPFTGLPTSTDVDGATGTPLSPGYDYFGYFIDLVSTAVGYDVSKLGAPITVLAPYPYVDSDWTGATDLLLLADTTLFTTPVAGLAGSYIPA